MSFTDFVDFDLIHENVFLANLIVGRFLELVFWERKIVLVQNNANEENTKIKRKTKKIA